MRLAKEPDWFGFKNQPRRRRLGNFEHPNGSPQFPWNIAIPRPNALSKIDHTNECCESFI
jgi:hypothetical protein